MIELIGLQGRVITSEDPEGYNHATAGGSLTPEVAA